jgi:hypothetical protein
MAYPARQEERKTAYAGISTLVLSVVLFVVSSTTSWAEHPADPRKTFTAPDGSFSFRYSSQLIQCQQNKQADGGYSWIPTQNCAAYFPVCDDEVAQQSTAIACFAYPKNKFTNSVAFEAATFSVETMDRITTEKDCLSGPPDAIFVGRSSVKIQGTAFAAFEFGEGGMSQAVGGHIYRAFHGGECYQLGINQATASAQTFDPPARELTKGDWLQVEGSLEQARDSFRFLK